MQKGRRGAPAAWCLACAEALEQSHTVPPGPGLVAGRDENRRERPHGCRHHAGVRGARDVDKALVPAVGREVAHRKAHWVLLLLGASVRLRPRRATETLWQVSRRSFNAISFRVCPRPT